MICSSDHYYPVNSFFMFECNSFYELKAGLKLLDISSGSIFFYSRANKTPQVVRIETVRPRPTEGGFFYLTAAATGVAVGGFIGLAFGYYFTYSTFLGAAYALITASLITYWGYFGGIVVLTTGYFLSASLPMFNLLI